LFCKRFGLDECLAVTWQGRVEGVFFRNGTGHYFNVMGESIRVDFRPATALASCCGVNLAWPRLGFGVWGFGVPWCLGVVPGSWECTQEAVPGGVECTQELCQVGF
jgi:hypothetical protein